MEDPTYTVTLYLDREHAEKYLEDGFTVTVRTSHGSALACPTKEEDEFKVVPVGVKDVEIPPVAFSWNALDLAEDVAAHGLD